MDIKPIRSEAEHKAALQEIESLMHAKLGTAEGDRLDVLSALVETYEQKHFPIDMPDPGESLIKDTSGF